MICGGNCDLLWNERDGDVVERVMVRKRGVERVCEICRLLGESWREEGILLWLERGDSDMHTDSRKGRFSLSINFLFKDSLNMKLKDAGSPFSLARAAHVTVI
jgi:hypothetical protein